MAHYLNQKAIEEVLSRALQADVDAAMDKVIVEAQKNLETALRKEVASIVMRLHKMYSVEMGREEIIIRVRNETQ